MSAHVEEAIEAIRRGGMIVVVDDEGFPGPMGLASPHLSAYALGWFIGDYRGHKIVSHTGGVLGAISALYLVPDMDLGIAV